MHIVGPDKVRYLTYCGPVCGANRMNDPKRGSGML